MFNYRCMHVVKNRQEAFMIQRSLVPAGCGRESGSLRQKLGRGNQYHTRVHGELTAIDGQVRLYWRCLNDLHDH